MGIIKQKDSLVEKRIQKIKEDRDELQRYVDELTMFLPLAFCTVNPLHLILGVNQEFLNLTGYSEMEVIGNEIDSLFVDKELIKKFKETIPNKKERVTEEAKLLVKDGGEILVSVSALARRDASGNFLGYFITVSDISEVKEFQKKLEERVEEKTKELEKKTNEIAESRLALLNILEETDEAWKRTEAERDKTMAVISNFTDGLIIFNKDNIIDIVNFKAEKFLERSANDLIGKKVEDLKNDKHLDPLTKILFETREFNDKQKREDDPESKKEIELKKGQTLEVSVVPIITAGEKRETLVVLHDISREKMVEAMKSEFVSIAAHQLRTPLAAIKWTMKMLLEGDLGELNEGQMELVNKVYISNERMVNLINDLLNVSRIEEGKYLYKPELVHIEDIVEPLLESYRIEMERRGIDFKIKKPKEKTPTVAVDNEKITLVIQNFLDNAMKYTPKGGSVEISIDYDKDINRVRVSVKDSGVGIPKNQQLRMFSKFFRAANVIRMETEGSGLGLFISKNIVEAHGGKIWFESEEGKGSTFYFNLPVKNKKEFADFLKKL